MCGRPISRPRAPRPPDIMNRCQVACIVVLIAACAIAVFWIPRVGGG